MANEDFRLEFEATQLASFLRAMKAAEPALATATRRNLRRAGDDTIADMRRTVASGPGSGRTGVQAGISRGLRTSVATGKRTQGVRLTGTAAQIPEGHKPMLRLYNKASFRHPVFGTDTWVSQAGRPYFGSVIHRHENEMLESVWQALEEALEKMAATT